MAVITATWSSEFFVNVRQHLYTYPTLWIVEDGNIYLTEKQAKKRCDERNWLTGQNKDEAPRLRFVRFDRGEDPVALNRKLKRLMLDPASFTDMFDEYERKLRKQSEIQQKTAFEAMTSEQARAKAIEELQAVDVADEGSGQKKEDNGYADALLSAYEVADIRKAIKATVNPDIHHTVGEKKIRELVDSFSKEDYEKVVSELGKNN